jgi:hypothetical protein
LPVSFGVVGVQSVKAIALGIDPGVGSNSASVERTSISRQVWSDNVVETGSHNIKETALAAE